MPRLVPFRLAAACALALLLLPIAAAALGEAKVPVRLRVVGGGGRVLAEETLRAGSARVPTSPRAECFGKGTGGSGKPVTIKGATALGLLGQAAASDAALRPLLITDHFSFGLALCGVGGDVARGEASWYLKVNHVNPKVGGQAVKLRRGDEVLWDLAPTYPYPNELALSAPPRAMAGQPFSVRVFSYDVKGKRSPAAGVKVTGAARPTGADGRTAVMLRRPALLIARGGGEIPSNRVAVCVGGSCPRG
jgi:hypothetical protein